MKAGDELSGRELQGYKVLDKIKDGSVGSIYMAGRDDQLFALKILFQKHLANPEKKSNFKREAKIARTLRHKNVIRTFEYYDGPPRPFFVMEFFPSENLRQILNSDAMRITRCVYMVLRQIAEGIQYCHSQGIVHRDVKPENILIGEKMEPKLIDFSIATTKLSRLLSFFTRKTAGSPNYMAPEQITNKKTDHRADIYSYGVMAYELLAGRLPFSGKSIAEVFQKHVKEATIRMSTINSKLPTEVCDFVELLLRKQADDRPDDLKQAIYIFGKKEKETKAIA